MRRIWRAAVMILAASGLMLSLGANAQAAPGGPTYVHRDLFLTSNPVHTMNTVCAKVHIFLNAGAYTWTEAIGPTTGFTTTWGSQAWSITLASGWYSWDVCIVPLDGYYQETTTLTPDNGSKAVKHQFLAGTKVGDSGTWRVWASLD